MDTDGNREHEPDISDRMDRIYGIPIRGRARIAIGESAGMSESGEGHTRSACAVRVVFRKFCKKERSW